MNEPRILVVEDEKVIAADIEVCATGMGYRVVGTAASGTEALRIAVDTMPDLVLMDIKLNGGLDGVDTAGALYHQLHIPVVYLTAHADREILERAKKTSPSGYVLKPFDERTLRTAIELGLSRHQRERRLIEGNERLAAALQSVDEAVIVTEQNGRVSTMNRLAEALTGWTAAEAMGRPAAEVFTTWNAQTGSVQSSPIGRVVREGIGAGLGESLLLVGRNGRTTPIQGSAAPVGDEDGEVTGACLLFRPASRHARDEEWGSQEHCRLSRLEILGQLTAGAARRFGTLFGEIRGGGQRLSKPAQHATQRGIDLATRLAAFGESQPGIPSELDLNKMILGLDGLLRCALGEEMELEMSLEPQVGAVKVDAGLLELLLLQLALSTRDGASRAAAFSIQTEMAAGDGADRYAVLSVRHNGAGQYAGDDLPATDELIRQTNGEIRICHEAGEIQIYLPQVN